MANFPRIITERIGKGLQLTRDDLLEIREAIAGIPAPRRWEIEGLAIEGVSLFVTNPDYEGDITLADLEDPADDELDRLAQ